MNKTAKSKEDLDRSVHCLERILKLNPNHEEANKKLEILK